MEVMKEITSLESRRANGRNIYFDIYCSKMKKAPSQIDRFCDVQLDFESRRSLIKWIRDITDRNSCQSLQILFAFSVPHDDVLSYIVNLKQPLISVGAGCGYWEFLLQQRGCDITCFDKNDAYPKEMHYCTIKNGGPEDVANHSEKRLFISWPDSAEESTFSTEVLKHYTGNTIIHIGELFGETLSSNPWGQSTTKAFQLQLTEAFRCIYRMPLPRWPGHMDTFTVWRRIGPAVECDGADFHYIIPLNHKL